MFQHLATRVVEKPWGLPALPAPFDAMAESAGDRLMPIGEIWFEPPVEASELLVKYIFAGEKLSVQVHPSDAQTWAAGLGRQGKEECWFITDATPGARLGIGFSCKLDQAAMHEAALDGSIETLLTWHEVAPGDFFYIPANTVHAIGAGVSVLEVQQNSDITYRLFDYGRPRELHLAQSLAVASGHPYDVARYHRPADRESAVLADGPFFRLERVCGLPDRGLFDRFSHPALVIPLHGLYRVAGHEGVASGQCALVGDLRDIDYAREGTCLVAMPLACG